MGVTIVTRDSKIHPFVPSAVNTCTQITPSTSCFVSGRIVSMVPFVRKPMVSPPGSERMRAPSVLLTVTSARMGVAVGVGVIVGVREGVSVGVGDGVAVGGIGVGVRVGVNVKVGVSVGVGVGKPIFAPYAIPVPPKPMSSTIAINARTLPSV